MNVRICRGSACLPNVEICRVAGSLHDFSVRPLLWIADMKLPAFLLLALSMGMVHAQQVPAFSQNVNLVTILATVHDRDGRILTNLSQNDFVLRDDGHAQTIRYFSQEHDLPLTIGLLVDTSRSQSGVLQQEIAASATFLSQVLHNEKDQAFIAHFDTQLNLLQGLTSSQHDLDAALTRLRIPPEVATLLDSAVRQFSNEPMRGVPGRKALILLTDGVGYKDPVSVDSAIEAAQRADVILYSIRFSDPVRPYRPLRAAAMAAMKEHGKGELERMARETGGVSYEVSKQQTIEQIYARIEADLRSQYSIGYSPGTADPDGTYHRIQLRTTNRDWIVDARNGYFSR